MSGISSSCSESPSQVLFNKGLEQVQEQRQLEEKQQLNSPQEIVFSETGEGTLDLTSDDPSKGTLFNAYA
ncbi:MAG: hypothetical protein OEZ43_06950 [Gammaproteobacteria bacterium]|nr:hypothetical protein [Gammaproteobacteria bacterium]